MNSLPMECINGTSVVELSLKYRINFFELLDYINKWKNKKLIKFKIKKNLL